MDWQCLFFSVIKTRNIQTTKLHILSGNELLILRFLVEIKLLFLFFDVE